MESLIVFLLIAAGSAIANWLKRRGETDWSEVELPPPPPRRVPPGPGNAPPVQPSPYQPEERKVVDWEAELRRMLGQPEPAAPPPPPVFQPAPPPPPQRYEAPKPPPPPPRRFEAPPPPPVRKPVYVESHTAEDEGPVAPITLNKANIAYDRASHLDETVRNHMDHIARSRVGMTQVIHQRTTQEAAKVVQLLKNPHSARQVILASVIISPPKAFES